MLEHFPGLLVALELVLPLAAAIIAGAGVASSAFLTIRRTRAEGRYVRLLRKKHTHERLHRSFKLAIADGKLTEEEFAMLARQLADIASRLDNSERHLILDALNQSSSQGRHRYVEKVLVKSGVAEVSALRL